MNRKGGLSARASAWATAIVAILGGAAFIAFIAPSILPYALTHDYVPFPSAGKVVVTAPARLYDPALQKQTQLDAAPDMPVYVPFVRPAFAALLYIPLSWLPLRTGFAVWIALGTLVLLLCWIWAARRYGPEILVYCAFFIPPIYGILHGQDSAFILGLALAVHLAMSRGAKVWAGVLLSLLLIKFHLFLLLPLVLLLRREWRILTGYMPGALLLAGISIAIAPVKSYLAILTDDSAAALNPSLQMMINAQSLAVNFGLNFAVVKIAPAVAILAAVTLIPRDAPWERWFWSAIIGGVLISPHAYEYDAAMFLMPILGILGDRSAAPLRRAIAATAAIPLPYFMTLLPKPYAAGPAVVTVLLFLAVSWPQWFAALRTAARALDASPPAPHSAVGASGGRS